MQRNDFQVDVTMRFSSQKDAFVHHFVSLVLEIKLLSSEYGSVLLSRVENWRSDTYFKLKLGSDCAERLHVSILKTSSYNKRVSYKIDFHTAVPVNGKHKE